MKVRNLTAAATALVLLLLVAPGSGQPTNALPGQPPIVTNGVVLPDDTFMTSTWTQVAAARGAVQSYSDEDLLNFLINTECLEAIFDSAATFGVPLDAQLTAGGPAPIGTRRANISAGLLGVAQETARDEAGHVRFIREALGAAAVPCPLVDVSAFTTFFDNAIGQTSSPPFDPFLNDVNLFLAIWSLEEIGSTGDKGVAGLLNNPTYRDAAIGLAVSAGYQSAVQRYILLERVSEPVVGYNNVTVAQAANFISQYRDQLSGPGSNDQGLYFDGGINVVPTDGNGLTFSRTPQQVLSILTFGAQDGRGGFFPDGVNGRINLPTPISPLYTSTRQNTSDPYAGTGFAVDPANNTFLQTQHGNDTVLVAPAPDIGVPVGEAVNVTAGAPAAAPVMAPQGA